MLIQNVSKRNFVLNIDGEIQTIVPNTLVEVSEELANDLINNYKIILITDDFAPFIEDLIKKGYGNLEFGPDFDN